MIKNLTPYDLTFIGQDGKTVIATLPPSGVVPRVREEHTPDGSVTVIEPNAEFLGGVEIPVEMVRYTDPEDLPDEVPGVYLVVSRITAQAAPDRTDLMFPIGQVRDEKKRIIGCTGLGRL